MERWLPISGYEGLYEVSDLGRVRGVDRVDTGGTPRKGKLLKISVRKSDARRVVSLSRGGQYKTIRVSTLVLETFVGPRPPKMEACHFPDRDPAINTLGNLRWDTRASNAGDMAQHGTRLFGEKQPNSKLTEAQVRDVLKLHRSGKSQSAIAASIGVTQSNISCIVQRKSWRHIGGLTQ